MRLITCTMAIATCLLVAGCGGYSSIRYPAVSAPDMLTRVVANPNFKIVDPGSFAEAAMLYPGRCCGTYHQVPVGDYLLSRVVLAMPKASTITALRLTEFKSVCGPSRMLAPLARCVTKAVFSVNAGGTAVSSTVEAEADVGPQIVAGDIAPPFNWGNHYVDVIHDEARKSVDAFAAKAAIAFAPFASHAD